MNDQPAVSPGSSDISPGNAASTCDSPAMRGGQLFLGDFREIKILRHSLLLVLIHVCGRRVPAASLLRRVPCGVG